MLQNELQPASGSTKNRKRIGRGNGSGRGTYCGRGMKGQTARSGGKRRPGFEGGQTPLIRKMPKLKGFRNPNKIAYQVVNLEKLEKFDDGAAIDAKVLHEKGMIANLRQPVKILGSGKLNKKLSLKVDKISASAQKAVEAAKGSVELPIEPVVEAKPAKKKVKKEAKEEVTEETK